MMRDGLPAHVLWLLTDHAATANPKGHSTDADDLDAVAFLYAPDDPFFKREVLHGRDHDHDPAAREAGWRLQYDYARLRAGWTPSAADLAGAPTLLVNNAYVAQSLKGPTPASQAVLVGRVLDPYGSPLPRHRVTSLVIAFEAKEGRWARTFNRFYRLMHDADEMIDPEALWREGE